MTTGASGAAARLALAGCIAADAEAAELLAAAPDAATLDAWVARRELGEPLAWITGRTTFCGRSVHVSSGTYVPRPQTEDLARRAAALLPAEGVAVDLCAGSGAVATHLRAVRPRARVVAVDVDPGAARSARANDLDALVADVRALPFGPHARVDLVTAVAPYVPWDALHLLPSDVRAWEPTRALDGGIDGLDVTRAVVAAASRLLRPGGALVVELGADQPSALAPTLARAGFLRADPWTDADGDVRGLVALRAEAQV